MVCGRSTRRFLFSPWLNDLEVKSHWPSAAVGRGHWLLFVSYLDSTTARLWACHKTGPLTPRSRIMETGWFPPASWLAVYPILAAGSSGSQTQSSLDFVWFIMTKQAVLRIWPQILASPFISALLLLYKTMWLQNWPKSYLRKTKTCGIYCWSTKMPTIS